MKLGHAPPGRRGKAPGRQHALVASASEDSLDLVGQLVECAALQHGCQFLNLATGAAEVDRLGREGRKADEQARGKDHGHVCNGQLGR